MVKLLPSARSSVDGEQRQIPAVSLDRVRRGIAFPQVAQEVGASPQQVTLAWMLAKGSRVIPIPGSSRPETAVASAAAADITLTPDQVARLDAT